MRDAGRLAWLGRIGWAAGVWGIFYPNPYFMCLMTLLVLPVVAFGLVILSRRRWTLAEASEGRLSLAGMAGLPAMVIGMRAFMDEGLVDWKIGALAGGALGFGLFLMVLAGEGRLKPGVLAVLLAACAVYGWGGLVFTNRYFDPAPAKVYRVRVLDKSSDKYTDPLTVTAWGPRPSGNEIDVDHAFSRLVQAGDTICVYVYPGAAHLPWYRYGLCR